MSSVRESEEDQKLREYRKQLWAKESEKLKERIGNVIATYSGVSENGEAFKEQSSPIGPPCHENSNDGSSLCSVTLEESLEALQDDFNPMIPRKQPESLKYKSLAEINTQEMQQAYENAIKEKELLIAKHYYLKDQMNQLQYTDNIFVPPSLVPRASQIPAKMMSQSDASNAAPIEQKGSLLFSLHNILLEERKRNQSLMEELDKIKNRNRAFEIEQQNKNLGRSNDSFVNCLKTKGDFPYSENQMNFHSVYSESNGDRYQKTQYN